MTLKLAATSSGQIRKARGEWRCGAPDNKLHFHGDRVSEKILKCKVGHEETEKLCVFQYRELIVYLKIIIKN
jgi:hypothetical protein